MQVMPILPFTVWLIMVLRFLGIFFHFVRIERLDQRRFQVVGGVLASLVSLVPLTMLGIFLRLFPCITFKRSCHLVAGFLRLLINWNFSS